MTIDALSIFFWLAAMFAFWIALEKSPQFSWWWPLTGLLIGLGFLSKYTNALELVSIVLVLAPSRRDLRHEFMRPGFYLLLAIFVSLHDSADCMEHATCLGHADIICARAADSSRLRISPFRVAHIHRRAFSRLFAIAVSGMAWAVIAKLAPGESAI